MIYVFLKKFYSALIPAVFLLFSSGIVAQINKEKITITEEGVTCIVQTNEMHLLALNPLKEYYSVYGSSIITQKGSVHGKVIHGKYYSYFRNKRIKSSGRFSRGLKCGEWTQWKQDGEITSIENYKKGLKHGKQEYWDQGKALGFTQYKKGMHHGDSILLNLTGDTLSNLTYKNGLEFTLKEKVQIKKSKEKREKEPKQIIKSDILKKIKKAEKNKIPKKEKKEKRGILKKLLSKKEGKDRKEE